MRTDMTSNYNDFVKKGLELFWYFYNRANNLTHSEVEISEIKDTFQSDNFEMYYNEFIKEFEENVQKYQDKKTIYFYLEDCFKDWFDWELFDPETERVIIKNKYEVEFLLIFKKALEDNINRITSLIYTPTLSNELSFKFEKTFYDAMIKIDKNYEMSDETISAFSSGIVHSYDVRFEFNALKIECNSLESNREKIQFIEERLIEFLQWQVQYDELFNDVNIGSYYYYTDKYYLNFQKLCRFELEKLTKKVEYEKEEQSRLAVVVNPEVKHDNKPFTLNWKASDTDLLEIIAAFHKESIFVRSDKIELKRKDLIDYFTQLFDLEIKDVEGKLARATNRNDKTPFLDRLKRGFENYAQEKDEKQRLRK